MMQSPILKITGLHKSFGDNEVLKGIDLNVSAGQLVFMIGPSGSGKSTLLRCCNRLEEPSSGTILVDGEDITAPRADLNRIRQNIGNQKQHFVRPFFTTVQLLFAGNDTEGLRYGVVETPEGWDSLEAWLADLKAALERSQRDIDSLQRELVRRPIASSTP